MASFDVPVQFEDGPWNGMLDSISPTAKTEGKYLLGQNIYPLDPRLGDGVVGRPGVRLMGAQLGTGATRQGQGTYQYTKAGGAEFTVQITGGQFYTLNWATETWTEVLTAAQLSGAGIVLDKSARVAFLTFTDKLLVSDGVNKPWLWDGTTGGGLTLLSNAEPFYGPPQNYFDRIFAISVLNPDTLIWSETDTPNSGYRSGGFNNAWSLTQTDPGRLYSFVTTNDAIYVFRARSGITLSGVPGPNFASVGTRDNLSDTIGTLSPWATILHDVNVLVLDASIHPQLMRPGSAGFVPIWRQLRETTKRMPKDPSLLAKCIAVYFEPAQLFLIAVPDTGAQECNTLLVYDGKDSLPVAVAVWKGWEMTTLAMVKNTNGQPYLLHSDTTGRVYMHGNPEDYTPWDDQLVTGTVAIEHILECQPLGYSTKREKIFDRIDVAVRSLAAMTLEISASTPRVPAPVPQIISVGTASQGYLGFDTGFFDNPNTIFDPGGVTTQESHGDVGIDLDARWIKPKIRHQALGEQFGITAITVEGYASDDDPPVP